MKKIIHVTLIVIIVPILNFAQEKHYLPSYIPPSPNAYELGKYGQIPVGRFTGTPNYDLPLYEYKTNNLAVPISVSYFSNGIKVDQVETCVGLGWSLNAGGVITRIVRDKPDEDYLAFYPEQEIDQVGVNSPLATQFFYEAGSNPSNNDTETDLFMYNFLGKSGKFVSDNDKKIIQMPHTDMKIEVFYIDDDNFGFKITASDGVKYIFAYIERSKNYIWDQGKPEFTPSQKTAWYLTKIIHPNGDEIDITYESVSEYIYTSSISQSVTVMYPAIQYDLCGNQIFQTPVTKNYENESHISGCRIKEICSNNSENGKVKFTYASGGTGQIIPPLVNISILDKDSNEVEKFDLHYKYFSDTKRSFLDSISFKDPAKYFRFEYVEPSSLIGRLSFQQDHWGYYNGATVNTQWFVPRIYDDDAFSNFDIGASREPRWNYAKRGLLSKIRYPTGGSTELQYEPNTYYGKLIQCGPLEMMSLSTHTDTIEEGGGGTSSVSDTIYSPMKQRISIHVNVAFNYPTCDSTHETGHTSAYLNIVNNSNQKQVPFYKISITGLKVPRSNQFTSQPPTDSCYADLSADTSYTVTLSIIHECVQASSHIFYYAVSPDTIDTNIVVGGSRIKKIIAFDPVLKKENITRYYYGNADSLNKSSGDPGQKAYYIIKQKRNEECDAPPYHIQYLDTVKILCSSSLTPLFNTGNNNIYYKYITVSHGGDNFENGGEEDEYIVHRDTAAKCLNGDDVKSAPWSNIGWDNGIEKRKTFFKKDTNGNNIILKEINNHYITDNRNFNVAKGYSIRKQYELTTTGPLIYRCTSDDISKYYLFQICVANHKHLYWYPPYFVADNCQAPGAQNVTDTVYHPCYHHHTDDTVSDTNMIRNLDIMEYRNLSYWQYLDSTTTTQYDQNGSNPVTSTTHYSYDNPTHIQLTRSATIKSNRDTLKSKTYYPQDTVQLAFMDSLISHYRIAEKIQEVNYVNGQRVSTQLINFNNWGNGIFKPWYISSSTYDNPLEVRSRFYNIDNTSGNPQEFSKEDDVHSSYVWGYQKTKPVIEGKGVSFDDLNTAVNLTNSNLDQLLSLTGIGDLTSPQQRTDWRNFNRNLRNQPLVQNALITTYTYKPLVGLSSTTDPNGITTYYEYDAYGRLIFVRDNDYNIVKKYDYHYANQ